MATQECEVKVQSAQGGNCTQDATGIFRIDFDRTDFRGTARTKALCDDCRAMYEQKDRLKVQKVRGVEQ